MAVCPHGHTRVWKHGEVPGKGGPKRRYICRVCGTTFYDRAPTPAPAKAKTTHTKKKK